MAQNMTVKQGFNSKVPDRTDVPSGQLERCLSRLELWT